MGKTKKNDARVLETGERTVVYLGRLAVSPHNVRKIDINDLDGLAASIAEHGLLQPLVVYRNPDPTDAVGNDEPVGEPYAYVAAGQRRMLAMTKAGFPDDTLVPVVIRDEATALELSFAENLERKDMNPADEVRAFAALIDTGAHTPDTIAARFGLPVKFVKRRCKMIGLHPDILQALQNGDITVDAAEAYAAASQNVQMQVFKKHSAKNAWKPHQPDAIRQDILLCGLSANNRIGKFIGGMKAYRKAGGEGIDKDFGDLFGPDAGEERMLDLTVVETLVNQAIANAAKAVEKAALKAFPFITGIEWMNLLAHSYGSDLPKLGKKSELTAVSPGWDQHSGDHLEGAQIRKIAKKAAEKEKAQVFALIDLDPDGNPVVLDDRFLIGKDAWSKLRPKPKKSQSASMRNAMTEEEREAALREQEILRLAACLFGRSLVGETPGFGITGCTVHKPWNMTTVKLEIELTFDQPAPETYYEDDGYGRVRFRDEVLEPFIDEATKRTDARLEAKAKAEAERQEELAKVRTGQQALFEELAGLTIADWPHEVTLTDEDGEVVFAATRAGDVIECFAYDGDSWETDDVTAIVEMLREGMNSDADVVLSVVREVSEPSAEEERKLDEAAIEPPAETADANS